MYAKTADKSSQTCAAPTVAMLPEADTYLVNCPDCGWWEDSFRPACARCDSTGKVRVAGRRVMDGTPADRSERQGKAA